MVKTQICLGYKDSAYASHLESTKTQQTERAGRRLDTLSPNQMFSILTPRRAWIENVLTLFCAGLILTHLSMNAYQVLSDGHE